MRSPKSLWLVAPLVAGLSGCGYFSTDEINQACESATPTLDVTLPLAGASVAGGDQVDVGFNYSSTWDNDTMDVLVNGTSVCGQQLSVGNATGTCRWSTNGLAPGVYELTIRASDQTSAIRCHSRESATPIRVQVLATVPVVTQQPQSQTIAEAATATFDVSVLGSGPMTFQWQKSIDAGINYVDVPGANLASLSTGPVPLSDDNKYYRVEVSNGGAPVHSVPAVLTVLAGECPAPPAPAMYDTSVPPAIAIAAMYGANLLDNAGFEQAVRVGSAPVGFGYWRFDQAVSTVAQQGVVPRTEFGGNQMLHFVGTGPSDAIRGGSSEQVQLVDVSALAADIDADLVKVDASAWFSRVAGCVQTDDAIGVIVMAYAGPPTTFAARWTNGINAAVSQAKSRDEADVSAVDAWLRHKTGQILHRELADKVGPIFGWRKVTATMDLPTGTRFVAIVVYATENKFNDNVFPELHGHYADDAAVVLTRR